jgi:hypothetical protein
MNEKPKSEPYKFLGLPEPRPVQERMNEIHAKARADEEAYSDAKGKLVAAGVLGAIGVGALVAGNYALEHDPVTQKFKEAEQNQAIHEGQVPQPLPENPSDLKIELPSK